jgi:hypothetical protein
MAKILHVDGTVTEEPIDPTRKLEWLYEKIGCSIVEIAHEDRNGWQIICDEEGLCCAEPVINPLLLMGTGMVIAGTVVILTAEEALT